MRGMREGSRPATSQSPGTSIETEKTIVAGTRSDLVVDQPAGDPIIIEVVVTHDLEPETHESYKELGFPVLKIRPDWDTLGQLESAVITADTLNVPPVRCAQCKGAAERRNREEERARSYAESVLQRLNERTPSDQSRLSFRPWTHDKFNRPMFPQIRQQVYANAIILTELGFVQSREKLWLFHFSLPHKGVIFANVGSTEEVAIWKDTAALIHWNLNEYSHGIESVIVERVLAKCRAAGAAVRVSFYGQAFDRGKELRELTPVGSVDKAVLGMLLAQAAVVFPEAEQQVVQARDAARNAKQAEIERERAMQEEAARLRQGAADSRRKAEREQWAQLNGWLKERDPRFGQSDH